MIKGKIHLLDEHDDWFSQEKRREARISVWDLDDCADVVKQNHYEHCQKEQVKLDHQIKHQTAENVHQQIKTNIKENRDRRVKVSSKGSPVAIFIVIVYILFMILSIFFD